MERDPLQGILSSQPEYKVDPAAWDGPITVDRYGRTREIEPAVAAKLPPSFVLCEEDEGYAYTMLADAVRTTKLEKEAEQIQENEVSVSLESTLAIQ